MQPMNFDLTEIPLERVKQGAVLDKIQQDFWSSFYKDYLSTLQTRYKWNSKEENLCVDDIVLLKEENQPPGVWPMARVFAVYPGPDGFVRNVRVRVNNALSKEGNSTIKHTEFNRAVRKLVRLSRD